MPTKARPDYRLTRHGNHGPRHAQNVVARLRAPCPKCATKTDHTFVAGLLKDRKCIFAICDACSFKRFKKWTEPSLAGDPERDLKAHESQIMKAAMNDWVANHARLLFTIVPQDLTRFAGLDGGGYVDAQTVRLPAKFAKHMEKSAVIERYAEAFMGLGRSDPELFAFIFLGAHGLTYAQMNGYFSGPLTAERPRKGKGSGAGRRLTGRCGTLIARRTDFLFGLAPDPVKAAELAARAEHKPSRALVDCPACNGQGDKTCIVCVGNQKVREKTARRYAERMAAGLAWEAAS